MTSFDFVAPTWLDWLAKIRSALRSHPESVDGLHGDTVAVGYRADHYRGEYAILTGFEGHPNDPRTLTPIVVEIAPGVEVELRELKVFLHD